jgi:hypothetical protein
VLGSFKIYSSTWYRGEAAKRGVIEEPKNKADPFVGTIALVIVGLDETRKVLYFAHTWGPSWGQRGSGEMDVATTAQATFTGRAMRAMEAKSNNAFNWSPPSTFVTAENVPASSTARPVDQEVPDAPSKRPEPDAASKTTQEPDAEQAREGRATPPSGSSALRRAVFDANHERRDWSSKTLPTKALARGEGCRPTGDPVVDATYDALGHYDRFFRNVESGGQREACSQATPQHPLPTSNSCRQDGTANRF